MRSYGEELKSKNFNLIYKDINKDYEKEIVELNSKISTLDTNLFADEEEFNSKSLLLNQINAQLSNKQEEISLLQADFKILNERKLNMASNKEEEQYLTSESGQNAISSSILRAFIEFKTELEKEN